MNKRKIILFLVSGLLVILGIVGIFTFLHFKNNEIDMDNFKIFEFNWESTIPNYKVIEGNDFIGLVQDDQEPPRGFNDVEYALKYEGDVVTMLENNELILIPNGDVIYQKYFINEKRVMKYIHIDDNDYEFKNFTTTLSKNLLEYEVILFDGESERTILSLDDFDDYLNNGFVLHHEAFSKDKIKMSKSERYMIEQVFSDFPKDPPIDSPDLYNANFGYDIRKINYFEEGASENYREYESLPEFSNLVYGKSNLELKRILELTSEQDLLNLKITQSSDMLKLE